MAVDEKNAEVADGDNTKAGDKSAEEPKKLQLEVVVTEPGACERHITVKIPRSEIDRYVAEAVTELVPRAQVPGFRQGKAPKHLVEKRFQEEVADRVKGSLLMDSMTQITEEQKFAAISEPKFEIEAIKIPAEGPLVFEFDIEVRPNFELPNWAGLKLVRPVHEYTEAEIDFHLKSVLQRHSTVFIKDGPVEAGDLIDLELTVRKGDDVLVQFEETAVRVKESLSFRDGRIENFPQLLAGAVAGDSRQVNVTLSGDANREELRGQPVSVTLQIGTVYRTELPKLSGAFLDKIGGFEDEDELRDTVRKELERQMRYTQQKQIRQQITAELLKNANWELPQDLLKRQFQRELDRTVLELRANGFTDDQIRTYQNDIRQNSIRSTATALKEHFILERIAEDRSIDAEPNDYELEIRRIAEQTGENPRRVRAKIDKRGQMDALRNQIVERKVIDLITSEAIFTDKRIELEPQNSFAIDRSLCESEEKVIPAAQHRGEAEALRQPALRG